MKKVSLLVAALLAVLGSVAAQAGTASNTFNVDINLTSACKIATVPVIAFNYASFQTTAVVVNSSFNIQCTNTLPITSVTVDGTGSYLDADTGLSYTLMLSGIPSAGTGVAQAVSVQGTMGAGQAGTCATATCSNAAHTNALRTLTIAY